MAVKGVSCRDGVLLLTIVGAALAASALIAKDLGTWALEIVWILLAAHALVLSYGGAYTHAETPLGNWVQDLLDTDRNNYDRFAHVVQGFVPAIVVREILLRRTPLTKVAFLTTTVCRSISVGFELVEWAAALILGTGADAFLGMQGDVWDTQWDMFLCLCGAVLAQLLLRRVHDDQLP